MAIWVPSLSWKRLWTLLWLQIKVSFRGFRKSCHGYKTLAHVTVTRYHHKLYPTSTHFLPLILFVGLWHRLGHILPRQGIDGLSLGGSYWSLMGRFHDGSQGLHHGIRTPTNSQVQQRDAPWRWSNKKCIIDVLDPRILELLELYRHVGEAILRHPDFWGWSKTNRHFTIENI